MTVAFEEAIIDVWRQVLVENAKVVEVGAERFPVQQTPKSRLRQVDFVVEGNNIRGLEQNPNTKSRWAQLARSGQKGDAVPQRGSLRGKCGRRQGDSVQSVKPVVSMNMEPCSLFVLGILCVNFRHPGGPLSPTYFPQLKDLRSPIYAFLVRGRILSRRGRIFFRAAAILWLICFSRSIRAQSSDSRATTSVASPTTPGTTAIAGKTYEVDVPATTMWLDTKIDLLADTELQFTATGTATYTSTDSKGQSKVQSFSANGLTRGWRDLIHQYPVANSGHGALIGRVNSGDGSQPFLIGESQKSTIPVPGRLFLGINQGTREAATAQGSFHVTITIVSAGTGTANTPFLPDTPSDSVTAELLGKIPRRVSDPSGNPGDMVNVLLVGTQDEVIAVFKAAGWVQVDRSVSDTILTGALATLSKEAYLTMPMSILYLFDRPQDYGFAHAEPVRVVESRNHLRAWKSPYEVAGRSVWCIAATHDIGFERDQRNNRLTHKIDPAVDGEREYVNDTLSSTGLVVQRSHVTPPDALMTAKTATGGEFHSDGRVLILLLKATIR